MGNPGRAKLWLPLLLVVTAIGLAACGDDDETTAAAEGDGEPIVIKTHLTFLEKPQGGIGAVGRVLSGSTIGDSDFCAGGKFSDRAGTPPLGTVVKTFRCGDDRLKVTFSPEQAGQSSLEQTSDWKVVSGTGRFEGMKGGGRIKGVFEPGGAEGRETFTGTVVPGSGA